MPLTPNPKFYTLLNPFQINGNANIGGVAVGFARRVVVNLYAQMAKVLQSEGKGYVPQCPFCRLNSRPDRLILLSRVYQDALGNVAF